MNASAERREHQAQPAALEARVAGDENALVLPEGRIHCASPHENANLRQWKASAKPLGARHSSPRRRIIESRFSDVNHDLLACEGNERAMTSVLRLARSSVSGTYMFGV